MVEMIGYLGSILVVVSMLMSSVVRLRIINTIGSGIFAAYALMIHSYPTALMNACLVGINVYNLVRLRQADRSYDLTEAAPGGQAAGLPAEPLPGGHPDLFPRVHRGGRGGPGLCGVLWRRPGRSAAGDGGCSGDAERETGLLHAYLP